MIRRFKYTRSLSSVETLIKVAYIRTNIIGLLSQPPYKHSKIAFKNII